MSRIAKLPRRDWRQDGDELADTLSPLYLKPGATGRLRPIQATALAETHQLGGCLVNARVGAGKTLIAGLLARLYSDRRPLILVPGGHKEKTEREFAGYEKDGWLMPNGYYALETYNALGRVANQKMLDASRPGIIICDEVDKLRRVTESACARRVARYMRLHPDTIFCGMTGTLFKEGLLDFAHMLTWALGDGSPAPHQPGDQADWHDGINGDHDMWAKMRHHLDFGAEGPAAAFRDRLFYTPGVIISTDQFSDVKLTLNEQVLDPTPVEDALTRLRVTGTTPDGWDTTAGSSQDGNGDRGFSSAWAAERQLALGFYYTPDPPPPKEWASARKRYMGFVRSILADDDYDTELQVRNACISGEIMSEAWRAWAAVKDTFTPSFRPVWISDHALDACKRWGREPGIVWTDHRAFASRLSAETGWRWFAGGGLDKGGNAIELAPGSQTIIASRHACGTGRNLQQWSRNLLTAVPGNGRDFEQVLGRTHREGQERDCHFDILIGCPVHSRDVKKVIDLSEKERQLMMRENKALTATWR